MTRSNLCALCLLAWLCLAAPLAAHAAESYDNCTGFITSIPAVIASQGTWCLKTDLNTALNNGNAIAVNANNVTIDCNNFKLGDLAAGANTLMTGIYALNRLNVTVRHCNIRGFYIGIDFAGASGGGHVVEDNRLDGTTYYGMDIEGDHSIIRGNRLFNIGGSNWISDATGIYATDSIDVLDNTVSGVGVGNTGNGFTAGITTSGNHEGRVIGNAVRGVHKVGTGTAEGINNVGSDRIAVRDNNIVGDGSVASVGLLCTSSNSRARNNTISGFASAIATCNNSGGNAVIP